MHRGGKNGSSTVHSRFGFRVGGNGDEEGFENWHFCLKYSWVQVECANEFWVGDVALCEDMMGFEKVPYKEVVGGLRVFESDADEDFAFATEARDYFLDTSSAKVGIVCDGLLRGEAVDVFPISVES